jgi:CDP-diacylglycerol--serine O-phosphatidyltransferase
MKHYKDLVSMIGWPGLATFASLFCSWSAIVFSLTNQPKYSILAATMAFQLDILDGYLARKLNKASEFGKQIDSLSDVINYSLLAAIVTSQYLLPGTLGFVVAFLILGFGVMRLALFNVQGFTEEGDVLYYRGVITCNLSLAALVFYLASKLLPVADWPFWQWLVAGVLTLLAVGQISTIKNRKTGVLILWIPVSLILGIGSFLWL